MLTTQYCLSLWGNSHSVFPRNPPKSWPHIIEVVPCWLLNGLKDQLAMLALQHWTFCPWLSNTNKEKTFDKEKQSLRQRSLSSSSAAICPISTTSGQCWRSLQICSPPPFSWCWCWWSWCWWCPPPWQASPACPPTHLGATDILGMMAKLENKGFKGDFGGVFKVS